MRRADGGEAEITSAWLVSCEGAYSVIRRQAEISFEGETYPMAFVLADVEVDWLLSHEENQVRMRRDGCFAALPGSGSANLWRLSKGVTLGAVQRLMVAWRQISPV